MDNINVINNKSKPMKNQSKTKTRVCAVTGIETSVNNFYGKQGHVKSVDNLRRTTGANRKQLKRMFNQLTTY